MKHSGQIEMNGVSEIEIENVAGNLRIRGGDEDKIVWRADGDDLMNLEAEQHDADRIRLGSYSGNLRLGVPSSTTLRIGSVGGNARIKSVTDALSIDNVGGELIMRKVGPSIIGSVGGNIQAKQVDGDLSIDGAGGNIVLLDILGDVRSAVAGGNIVLANVQGGVQASAGGNAKLHLTPIGRNEYNIVAGHNIHCYMPPEASVRVHAHSPRLELHWPGVDRPTLEDENVVDFELGDGEASLALEAGHIIEVYCQSGRVAEDFEDRDEQDEYNVDFDFDFDLSNLAGLLPERVQRKVQQAMHQAEEHIANAMHQVEHNIAEAEHRIAHMSAQWESRSNAQPGKNKRYKRKTRDATVPHVPPHVSRAPRSPRAPDQPVGGQRGGAGDEERMMILKMIEEGKIDVEQAEKLLTALGESN